MRGHRVICVVVLQNSMDLQKGELGLSSKAYVSSTVAGNQSTCKEAERVSEMTEEVKDKPTAISIIKTEPNVSCVPLVGVMHVLIVLSF
jgi:hypothetical protein